MRLPYLLRRRIESLLFRKRAESDLREELELHLEREAEHLQAAGLAPDAARQHARRRFGNVESIKEACRDARGVSTLETLARDLRYALRTFRRDWRFSIAAVLILGVGIGATTAVFSLIDAVMLRRPELPDAGRLVDIYQRAANPGGQDANTYPAYQDIAAFTDVFAAVTAASVPRGVTYERAGVLRPAVVENTTSTYLAVLGLRPSLGRWFTADEDTPGGPVMAVMGYETWKNRFNADPAVIGRTITIDGVLVTIVGVGPRGHDGTLNVGLVTDFWLPVRSFEAFGLGGVLIRRPTEAMFLVKARLRSGVTVAGAQAAMNILGRRLAKDYPRDDPGEGILVLPSNDVWIHPQVDGPMRVTAAIVLGIVGLVLAIASSNLATLLLVRGASRRKEISIRLAVGASRRQLVRQLLTETLLLSFVGGAGGCLLAAWGIQWLRTIELPIVIDVVLDWRVLAFSVAVSVVTGVACGLVPALSATRVDLLPSLRNEGVVAGATPRTLTLKNGLIVFQIAVSVLLLGGASLFLQWAEAERARPAGYAVDGVAMLETDSRFSALTGARARAMYDELLRRTTALPGVESAALTRGLPMRMTGQRILTDTMGDSRERTLHAGMVWAAPAFLETLRIGLLYGRTLDTRDRPDTPRVAVISETMAREYFGAVDAVGRRFRLESSPELWIDVVGVVRDTGPDLTDPLRHVFYLSYAQTDLLPTTIVARTSRDAEGLLLALQREVRDLDSTLPVVTARTMAQDRQEALKGAQAIAASLGALGALGLLLASVGLYAVIAFAVARRSPEIGIRLAIGAPRPQVVWTVVSGFAVTVGAGTIVGLGLSVIATLALRAAYAPAPGVSLYRPNVDPVALLEIAAIIAVVSFVAAFVPARRAARTEPMVALRPD